MQRHYPQLLGCKSRAVVLQIGWCCKSRVMELRVKRLRHNVSSCNHGDCSTRPIFPWGVNVPKNNSVTRSCGAIEVMGLVWRSRSDSDDDQLDAEYICPCLKKILKLMVTEGYMGRQEHMCGVYYEMFYVKGLRAARACAARHAKQKSSTASTFFWISVPKFCAQYCKVGRGAKNPDRILTFTQEGSRQRGGCRIDFSHALELQSMMATTKCLWKCYECVIISWKNIMTKGPWNGTKIAVTPQLFHRVPSLVQKC